MPTKDEDLPGTINRSPDKAKRTYAKYVEGHTLEELYQRAKNLDVDGRSTMDKHELGQAIADKQD